MIPTLYDQLWLARAAGDIAGMYEIARLIVAESIRETNASPWTVSVA